jgi:hypothetical protein
MPSPVTRWSYSVAAFMERMRMRLRNHSEDDHQPCPAKGRYTQHMTEASRRRRANAYAADDRALKPLQEQVAQSRFGLLDLDTGEIKDLF